MQKCIGCKELKDYNLFYLGNDLCKDCIKNLRKSRISGVVKEVEKAEREQQAIRNVIKQFQTNNESYVYLIEASDRYKIGYSKNIDRRVSTFNTANSVPCKIIAVAPGGRQLEKYLHDMFECSRINREWFKNNPLIIKTFTKLDGAMIFLKGYIRKEGSPPPCRMGASNNE